MPDTYRRLRGCILSARPCALVTLVSATGSCPQEAGAKLLVLPDGRTEGTVGGGCVEAEARRSALAALRDGKPRLLEMGLDDDFGWDDGLVCGGRVTLFVDPCPAECADAYRAIGDAVEARHPVAYATVVSGIVPGRGRTFIVPAESVSDPDTASLLEAASSAVADGRPRLVALGEAQVYVEPVVPPPLLLVCGAGHIGAAVCQAAALSGFEVVVVDDRPIFADAERLPGASLVAVADIPSFVRDFPIGPDTYVVIVTRGHRHDAQSLRECIHSPARYVGMIGSRRKVAVVYDEMLREGLATREELERVHAPIGLSIGARDPGEIATSIVAELVAVRRGANLSAVRPMRQPPSRT